MKEIREVTELNARDKASIIAAAEQAAKEGMKKAQAIAFIIAIMKKRGIVDETSGTFDNALSVALSFYAFVTAQLAGKAAFDCIAEYALFKRLCAVRFSDYGAFGDLVETSVRVASKPRALVQYTDLHVKRSNDIDITLRGIPCEVGTNGKTFSESTESNPFSGKYERIIYGVFSDDDKEKAFQFFARRDINGGLHFILSHMYMFDTDVFNDCMITCGTAKNSMLVFKNNLHKYQVAYTEKRYYYFKDYVKSHKIQTVADFLNK